MYEYEIDLENCDEKRTWSVYIPLWVRISLFIFFTTAVSITILMLVSGFLAWKNGTKLMEQRLANYAAMKSIEIEQNFNDVEYVLQYGLSRGVVAKTLNDYDYQIVTHEELESMISQMLHSFDSTKDYQAMYFYDARGQDLVSHVQAKGNESLSAIIDGLSSLLPLQNSTREASLKKMQSENLTSLLCDPIRIMGSNGNSTASVYSITLPVNYVTTDFQKNTSITRIVGYATTVLFANTAEYLEKSNNEFFDTSDISLVRVKPADKFQWTYVLPSDKLESTASASSGVRSSDGTLWYSMTYFPAILDAVFGLRRHESSTEKARGATMRTRSPRLASASVGYSSVNLGSHRWYLLVEIPQSAAYSDLVHMRNVLIGTCCGILAALCLTIVPLTRAQTMSFYRIYQGMELKSSHPSTRAALGKVDLEVKESQFSHPAAGHMSSTSISSGPTLIGATDSISHSSDTVLNDREGSVTDSEFGDSFQIPSRICPLNRWYKDELDELVEEYNLMIDRLNQQYHNLEGEIRTRTKEAEQARVLAEAANRAKGLFIANITHELRTPLNGIMGMTTISAAETDRGKIQLSLRTILDSSRTLMELLNELLMFSRSQLGIRPEPIDFNIAKLLDSLKSTIQGKPIETRIDVAVDKLTDLPLRGDFYRIHQVVTNILSNALKFTKPDSTVCVHIGMRVKLDSNMSLEPYVSSPLGPTEFGQVAVLEVQVVDTGLGISAPQLARIFDMFAQGDETLSKKHRGTGIGMSLSKQFAEGIGGYILVSSAENVGSTVVLRAPVLCADPGLVLTSDMEPPEIELNDPRSYVTTSNSAKKVTPGRKWQTETQRKPRPETMHIPPAPAQAVKVLVVDDNKLNRTILEQMLRRYGVDDIELAPDGKDAITRVEQSIIDGVFYSVIFMDLDMPGINGLEATQVIRSTLGYPYPIVALTGYSDPKTVKSCEAANIQEVLIKPILKKDIVTTLHRYTSHQVDMGTY